MKASTLSAMGQSRRDNPPPKGRAPVVTLDTETVVGNLTLRDYFAAKAMAGLIAAHDGDSDTPEIDSYAEDAYRIADAMLQERAK